MSALAVSIARDVHAAPPADTSLSDRMRSIEAQDRLWADVASYQEWLRMHCDGVPPEYCRIDHVPSGPVSLANFIAGMDVPQLVYLQNWPRADVCWAATQRLKAEYEKYSQSALDRIASEVETEIYL